MRNRSAAFYEMGYRDNPLLRDYLEIMGVLLYLDGREGRNRTDESRRRDLRCKLLLR
jgi:hypothetical protein